MTENATCNDSKSYPCDAEIFNLDLPPAVEKLSFIADTGYYHLENRRTPTPKELARDIGCSEARAAIAMQMQVLSKHIVYNPEPSVTKT